MPKIDTAKIEKQLLINCLDRKGLAEATGISANSISKLCNGQAAPRATTLKKITEALGCEVMDIIKEE